MNTSNLILVTDVNVIIHLDKAGLLDELTNDKRIRIVDLMLYNEYQFKKNLASGKVEIIKTITLNDKQLKEAINLHNNNKRNSFYDYCAYVAARDNDYVLLSGDFKLKKAVNYEKFHGTIWYVQDLFYNGIISKDKLKSIYETWISDPTIYLDENKLIQLIEELNNEG